MNSPSPFLFTAFTIIGFSFAGLPIAPSRAATIFHETFEDYANHSAFASSWNPNGTPPHLLDTAFGHNSSHSVRLTPQASGGGVSNRWYKNLSVPASPSDAQPLIFSFDFYLDPAGDGSGWAGDWQLVDIRSYSGGGFGLGAINGLVGLGVARASSLDVDTHDSAFFQGRILAPGHATRTYYSLDGLGTASPRSSGWHTLSATFGATSTLFSIDGEPAESVPVGFIAPINTIVLGSDISSSNFYWVDNVRLERIPEPSAIWIAIGGGLSMCARGRQRHRPPVA